VPGAKGAAKDRKALLTALRDTLDGMPHYSAKGPPDVDLNGPKLGGQRVKGEKVTVYDSLVGPDEDVENLFGVPTLESMGMDPEASGATKTAVVPGGEKAALKRLAFRCKDPAYFATFSKPKSSPALDTSEASTALLSPYLKFGAISCRRVWWDAHDAAQKYKGKHTPIPENFKGQQLFNLMYSVVESATGDAYQHVRGNEISRYVSCPAWA
jgi:cryptochrome